jgi:hypothetical protein
MRSLLASMVVLASVATIIASRRPAPTPRLRPQESLRPAAFDAQLARD